MGGCGVIEIGTIGTKHKELTENIASLTSGLSGRTLVYWRTLGLWLVSRAQGNAALPTLPTLGAIALRSMKVLNLSAH